MLAQLSTQPFHNRQFEACATVDSTLVQSLIRHLDNSRVDSCTTVESSLGQPLNR